MALPSLRLYAENTAARRSSVAAYYGVSMGVSMEIPIRALRLPKAGVGARWVAARTSRRRVA